MIISTGLSNLKELKNFKIAKKYGAKDITLLYCVSKYPSNHLDFDLNNLEIYKKKFNCRIGLSDHSIGTLVPSIAIAKGAVVIEKHVCLNNIKTVDSEFSLKSSDFKDFVLKINDTFKICQKKNLNKNITFLKNKIFQRSIYAVKNIKKGEYFNDENIKTFRPSLGLSLNF